MWGAKVSPLSLDACEPHATTIADKTVVWGKNGCSPASSTAGARECDRWRHLLLQQRDYVAKPTAYAPYARQEEHPLSDQREVLVAKLAAVRDVRRRLVFLGPSKSTPPGAEAPMSNQDDDVGGHRATHEATAMTTEPVETIETMDINTRVALSTSPLVSAWRMAEPGIAGLGAMESLLFAFFSTSELVVLSGVCRAWHAIARDDHFWEPLLFTPVERYPLRRFLGLERTPLPAIQVFIIFNKLQARLQVLCPVTDDSPGQTNVPRPFIDLMRHRRAAVAAAAAHEAPGPRGAVDAFAMAHRAIRRTPAAQGASQTASAPATATVGDLPQAPISRDLYTQSVHLLSNRVGGFSRATFEQAGSGGGSVRNGEYEDVETNDEDAPRRGFPRVALNDVEHALLFNARTNGENDDGDDDERALAVAAHGQLGLQMFEMLEEHMHEPRPPIVMLRPQREPPDGPPVVTLADGSKRLRLSSWLSTQPRPLPEHIFRSFLRQLLIAIATLERDGCVHGDIAMSNIFVLSATGLEGNRELAGATDGDVIMADVDDDEHNHASHSEATEDKGGAPGCCPIFQLYCLRSVNTWFIDGLSSGSDSRRPSRRHRRQHHQADPPGGHNENDDDDDDDQEVTQQAAVHHHHQAPAPPPRAAAAAQNARQQPHQLQEPEPQLRPHAWIPRILHRRLTGLPQGMVRAFLRVAGHVWLHNNPQEFSRSLDLAQVFLQPSLYPPGLRALVEYAEYLLSRRKATATRLLAHAYVQGLRWPMRHRRQSPSWVIHYSPLRPRDYPDPDHYRTRAVAWHAEHRRPRPPAALEELLDEPEGAGDHWTPRTRLGSLFFREALSERHLASQRFLSVVAPTTATSSWVRALATSQTSTLEKLDLSRVRLPTSVLLRELAGLGRLTHLRLPRELLRDENLEQFVTAIWCEGALPRLRFMDHGVGRALERLEGAYAAQLDMITFLLAKQQQRPVLVAPSLQH